MSPDNTAKAGGTPGGPFEIRSEARGPHWIAWIVRAGSDKPDSRGKPDSPESPDTPNNPYRPYRPYRGIVLVAATREDAEARARQFAEQSSY